jgi:hypothetical protein
VRQRPTPLRSPTTASPRLVRGNNTLLTEQLKQISRATPDIEIETTGFELTEIGLLTAGTLEACANRPGAPPYGRHHR